MRNFVMSLAGTLCAVLVVAGVACGTLYFRNCLDDSVRDAVSNELAQQRRHGLLHPASASHEFECPVACVPQDCNVESATEFAGATINSRLAAAFVEELCDASPAERQIWTNLLTSEPSPESFRALISYYRRKTETQPNALGGEIRAAACEVPDVLGPAAPPELFVSVLPLDSPSNHPARAVPRLEFKAVTFCHRITSFGNYEPIPRAEFTPGQDVIIYAELENLQSRSTPEGKFQSLVKSAIEFSHHESPDQPLERIDLPETVDLCRVVRRAYFHSYQFAIPANLTPGQYVVKLTVEDQIGHGTAIHSLPCTVK